jgi:8-oxo-dGTP diphosphatase
MPSVSGSTGMTGSRSAREAPVRPEKPLYERDPDAWRAYLAEGDATQPRKRVGVDMLIRDERGRLLWVDPKYKSDWDLPGGMSEANEEPADTARRELKEELGLDIRRGGCCASTGWRRTARGTTR